MRTPTLGLILLAVSPAFLLVRGSSTPGRTAEPDARPAYKNPLDVSVDKEGKKAIVQQIGKPSWAIVDLVAGKVEKELPWVKDVVDGMPRMSFGDGGTIRVEPSPSYSREEETAQHALNLVAEPNSISGARVRSDCVFVVHQRPKSRIPATQVTQGWIFTNVLTTLRNGDEKGHKVFGLTAALDEPQKGYANPTDVVVTPGGYAFVACGGADTVLAIDLKAFQRHARPLKLMDGPRDTEPRNKDWRGDGPTLVLEGPDDLTASRHFIKAKLPTQANPRRLGLSGDGKTLVVSNYLADSLTVIDVEKLKVVKHIPLGGPAPDAARRGEVLFNSGRMTFQGAFTCASCHPNGGADGLNWDLTRDGVGNFKNTKSLLGIRDTAPYGWEGKSATLEDRVTGTLRTLHQHEPTGTEVADLVAYLQSLPPPKPEPVAEKDREAVARGVALFQGKARCATCHKRAGYDDGKSHDVGTRGETDTTDAFDTPSLRGVARTAPYLHDGRAATLEEIFTRHNPEQRHGAAHLLSDDEFKDLIAYLKSL
jgi:YVTN family beta-propeller protein